MSIRSFFGRLWSGPKQRTPSNLRAKYDAARTTTDNSNHWANADGLSASAANAPGIREKIRKRARYECQESNSWAKGITQTLANDTIGTGPRLNLSLDPVAMQRMATNTIANSVRRMRMVQKEFSDWAAEVGLACKLRTMRIAKAVDGEAFAVLTFNPALRSRVKLDVKLIEADRVSTPDLGFTTETQTDGIRFDEYGNPSGYDVLKQHPGAETLFGTGLEYDTLPAPSVVHWFRCDRPGQLRGISEFVTSLPLFAQLRRYREAVMSAAETAADIAGVVKSTTASVDPAELVAGEAVDIEPRSLLTLADGWDISQFKAEQPATTYAEFSDHNLNEVGRPVGMPLNVSKGNSANHNYASGRLDHQKYHKAIRVERTDCELTVLAKLWQAWSRELELLESEERTGMLPNGGFPRGEWLVGWFWDGFEHVDPNKEANAQQTRLNNHTTTLAAEYAMQGQDWEPAIRQRAREVELMRELKLPVPSDAHQTSDDVDPEEVAQDAAEEARQRAEAN